MLHGMPRIVPKLDPFFVAQPADEGVGIIGRRTDQRQQFSRIRVHDHHGPGPVAELVHAELLHGQINGQVNVLPGLGRFGHRLFKPPSRGVHFGAPAALDAAQSFFLHQFDALLAHQIAHGQLVVLVYLLFIRFRPHNLLYGP